MFDNAKKFNQSRKFLQMFIYLFKKRGGGGEEKEEIKRDI